MEWMALSCSHIAQLRGTKQHLSQSLCAHLGVREQRSRCHRLPSVIPTWELELNKPFPGVAQVRCHPSFLRIGSSLFWTFTALS